MSKTFLETSELVELTGRRIKSKQITALRAMGIPFLVNATGHPVVTRSVIEGSKQEPVQRKGWAPKVLQGT